MPPRKRKRPAPEHRRMKIADLAPAPYNPRKISDQAMAGLTASINRFGLVQPIVWNARVSGDLNPPDSGGLLFPSSLCCRGESGPVSGSRGGLGARRLRARVTPASEFSSSPLLQAGPVRDPLPRP
jgi:hypothetical protein